MFLKDFYHFSDINRMLEFWKRIKILLKDKNINQQNLAASLDIPSDTFSKWIQKDRLPDAEQTYKIANALGVSVEYLVTGNQSANKEKIDRIVESLTSTIEDIKNLK